MSRPAARLVEGAPLPYLLSVPEGGEAPAGGWPLLCFLHGYGEGAPMPIREALALHGPLAPTGSPRATTEFVVLAPQLPIRGDHWHGHAEGVEAIVREAQARHGADRERTALTGFSFGGNGVFDLALEQPGLWSALWPVDPTRVPRQDPGRPVWLSVGEISRMQADAFVRRLHLAPPVRGAAGDRVYVDQGQDHVGTARLAYRDDRIYDWLLSRRLTGPAPRE
jgi:predicted peptidase